jgi:CDP-diacylglycerol--serine O-phosphatidyltransferase
MNPTQPEAPPSRRRLRRRRQRGDPSRAIFLLPNLFTTASLVLGFWSIVEASRGRFGLAALGIFLAGFCDMLDGRIARATRSTSRFGVEYDSLADMVSFGVAPAFLIYSWSLAPLGRRGWAVAALFMLCAALRLARFNVQTSPAAKGRYGGLPSTMAGGFVAVTVWFVNWLGLGPPLPPAVGLAFTAGVVGLALLMVSSVPYPSIGSLRIPGRHGFSTLVAFTIGVVVILLYQEPVLFAIGLIYILAGPALWLRDHRARAQRPEVEVSSREP